MSRRWLSIKRKANNSEASSLKKLAAGSLTFAKAYSNGEAKSQIDHLEQELEEEIKRDTKSVPDTKVARFLHKGRKLLRSKNVLMMIVILNVFDCGLVLGELILDLHHVKDILTNVEQSSSTFLENLQNKYPDEIEYTDLSYLEEIYSKLSNANIEWINDTSIDPVPKADSQDYIGYKVRRFVFEDIKITNEVRNKNERLHKRHRGQYYSGQHRLKRSSGSDDINSSQDKDHKHSTPESTEEEIARGFHATSIGIVLILLTETIFKVICFGKQFFEKKLEVFDACIVALSFVVDLVFLKGLSVYTIQEFVFILAFMLPWGVIRVVNSLVVAVRDHECFRLKLLFTQKKRVDCENNGLRQEKAKLLEQIELLKKLCLVEGIDEWKIQQNLVPTSTNKARGLKGSFASLAFGSLVGTKENGRSFWNMLHAPKMRRGKSEEWTGKLGVSKEDTISLKDCHKNSVSGSTQDLKKNRVTTQQLSHQFTVESDPGTAEKKSRFKAIKRFLKRQETVSSYSSNDTIDKLSSNHTPSCSIDDDSVGVSIPSGINIAFELQRSDDEHDETTEFIEQTNDITQKSNDNEEV
ncbi:uncharacterized protein LOC127706577 [Mytilus californianus]|uniref:uncharacterized protein LOC127706577 n=1 Tax=Mytilus californianus TaxID=6549 RepID=UPI0022466DCC|nr:uncharacterized protein LOC127706577 [Mytilus californianus]